MKKILLLGLLFSQLNWQTNAQRSKNDPLSDLANSILGSQQQKSNDKRTQKAQAEAEQLYSQAMQDLALKLSSDLLANNKKKVAVVNFMNTRNEGSELGKFLAEEFSALLFSKKLIVIDRSQLEYLMNENKISSQGMLNPSEVAKLGKLAGVQVIITGTITLFDKNLKLALKGIDVEQGVVVGAALGTIPRTESIDELYNSDSKSGGQSGGNPEYSSSTSCKSASDCKNMSLGGVCVHNKSNRDIEVRIYSKEVNNLLIHPGKSEGINQLQIKGDFQKMRVVISGEGRRNEFKMVSVEACKVENVTVN